MATTRGQAAKKTAARTETPARQQAASREDAAPRKRAAPRKQAAPRKRTAPHDGAAREESGSPEETGGARKKIGAVRLARGASEQLTELTGRAPETVTGLERTDDGWRLQVELVEVRRIPDSADIIGLYQVELDEDGELMGYQRVQRYARGRAMDGSGT